MLVRQAKSLSLPPEVLQLSDQPKNLRHKHKLIKQQYHWRRKKFCISVTSPEVTQTVLELVRVLVDCPEVALHLARHTKLFETFLKHIVGK